MRSCVGMQPTTASYYKKEDNKKELNNLDFYLKEGRKVKKQ